MTKLEEEIYTTIKSISMIKHDGQTISAVAEVAKKYIEKAFDAGHNYGAIKNQPLLTILNPELKDEVQTKQDWLKKEGVI